MMKLLKKFYFFFSRMSVDWMIADIFNIAFENGWRIETYSKSKLFAEKFLIRIDDIDEEYKSVLYAKEYKPIVLIEADNFESMVLKAHEKIVDIIIE